MPSAFVFYKDMRRKGELMKMKKRLTAVALLLAICLCLPLLVACDGGDDDVEMTTSDGKVTEEGSKNDIETSENTSTAENSTTIEGSATVETDFGGSDIQTSTTDDETDRNEGSATEESAVTDESSMEQNESEEASSETLSTETEATETTETETKSESVDAETTEKAEIETTETETTEKETETETTEETTEETEETVPTEPLIFEENGDGYTLVSANKQLTGSIDIPAEYEGKSVTAIGEGAFRNCFLIEAVVLPETVTSIGAWAFFDCASLKSINITDSITAIGAEAFNGCGSLTELVIPNSVASVGFGMLRNCRALESLSLPFVGEAPKEMGATSRLFGFIFGCDNTDEMALNIPATLKNVNITGDLDIGSSAFNGCSYIETVTISGKVSIIESNAFKGCSSLREVAFPESLTAIKDMAFHNCSSLAEIIIPDSVQSIGGSAFYGCSSVLRARIGKSVEKIGSNAFFGCLKLVEVLDLSKCNIQAGNYDNGYAGYYAKRVYNSEQEQSNVFFVRNYGFFLDDSSNEYYLMCYVGSNTELSLPESINDCGYRVNNSAFENNSKITSVVIPAGVKSIGKWAFNYCSELQSVVISDGVLEICDVAFGNCPKLSGNIDLPSSLIAFGDDVFTTSGGVEYREYGNAYYLGNDNDPYLVLVTVKDKSVTSFEINDTVKFISNAAFSGCNNLSSIIIPDSVKSIGSGAFAQCAALESVTVGKGVEIIRYGAFSGYTEERVYISDLEAWLGIEFSDMTANPLHLTSELYLNGALVSELVIPEGTTEILPYTFAGYNGLVSVTLPEGLEKIGESAFAGCRKLVEIYNLSGLNIYVGDYNNGYVSYYAKDIYTSKDQESKIEYSGDYIFYYNGVRPSYYLLGYTGQSSDIVLPEDFDGYSYEIYNYAFAYRGNINSVTINNGAMRIGNNAFEKCFDLKTVTVNGGVETVGVLAFFGCPSLEKAIFSSSVRTLEEGAFQSCSLAKITVGMGLSEVGYAVFYNCQNLTTVNYVGSEWSWGQISVSDNNEPLLNANIKFNYAP